MLSSNQTLVKKKQPNKYISYTYIQNIVGEIQISMPSKPIINNATRLRLTTTSIGSLKLTTRPTDKSTRTSYNEKISVFAP